MSCNSIVASASPLPEYDGYDGYDAGCGCNQPAYADYAEPQQLAYALEQQPLYDDYVQSEPVYEQLETPAYALEQVYDEGLIGNNYIEQPVLQQQPAVVYQQEPQQVVYQQQQQPIVYQEQQPVVYQQQQQAIFQQQPQQAQLVYQQQQQLQQPAVVYQQAPQQLAYYQQPARQVFGNDCGCNRASPVQYVQRPIQAPAPTPTTYNKTVVTNLNRHHIHTIRVVDNTNQYNKHVTNHVTKVNDIHHYRVENVKGETRTFNDYKETRRVEPARCINGNCGRN